MKILQKGAPAAAIVAALSGHVCCVPLGLLGSIGFAGVQLWMRPLRNWLLGASILLLCLEFGRLYFAKSARTRRSPITLVLFWGSVTIVVFSVYFPQVLSKLIAS
jgi:hypothetical protein